MEHVLDHATTAMAYAALQKAGLSAASVLQMILTVAITYGPKFVALLPVIIADIQASGGQVNLEAILKIIQDVIAGLKTLPTA